MKKQLIILSLILPIFCLAQNDCTMQIGTNLPPADEQVFKDLKWTSTHFFTANEVYTAGDPNDWDTELIETIPLDQNGYPTIDIPFVNPTSGIPQIYHFICAGSGIYPEGHYILQFEGDGILQVSDWSDASNITQINDNRIEFDVNTTTINGIHVEVLQSSSSNHVHNISIVHQDDLLTFESQPFREELVNLASDFECLRFMDWMATNQVYYDATSPYDNTIMTWNDRVGPGEHRQNMEERGMAYEHLISFANTAQKDVWVNIPHRADDGFIQVMANLFKDQLDPSLTIHLEFSNEVWNGIFQQTDFVENEGPYPNDIGRNLGWYAGNAFQIWEQVFIGESNRLKLVIAGHDWIVIDAMSIIEPMGIDIDMASYPGYFNMSESQWNELSNMGATVTVTDIVNRARTNMQSEDFYWMNEFKELVCDAYDLEFTMYEGGQHLLRLFGVEESFQPQLYQTQISPDMYDLYSELLTFCRDSMEVKLFNHFTLFGPNESSFGSWGMVESVYETPNTPKYNALMDFACEADPTVNLEESPNSSEIQVFPNPADERLIISFSGIENPSIQILDLNGKLISEPNVRGENEVLDVSHLPPGTYFIKVFGKEEVFSEKIILF